MRLIIKRWYEPPSPGQRSASPYKRFAVLELTDEEREVVAHYGLGTYVLTQSQHSVTTLDDVLRGSSSALSDPALAMRNEEVLRHACENLPALLDYCRSFGRDLVFEYTS